MTLLDVERIKLFSTRSPWWCLGAIVVIMLGLSALIATFVENASELNIGTTQAGYYLALMVTLVMATIAITNEYRFGTIRATFAAAPNRTAVLVSKTAVVALIAGLIGVVSAFGAWAVAKLIRPEAELSIATGADWRSVAGVGLVFAFAAVLAVAVGVLIRHTAGAVSILLIWAILIELFGLIRVIPRIGDDIAKWLPFTAANHFITAGRGPEGGEDVSLQLPYGPWGGLAYFAGVAVALLVVALAVAERRDA